MGTADRSRDVDAWGETVGVVAAALDERRVDGWLTGGCVRDTLLGMPVGDVDLVIAGDARTVVETLPSGLLRGVGALHRDTVRLVFHTPGAPRIDISSLR